MLKNQNQTQKAEVICLTIYAVILCLPLKGYKKSQKYTEAT
jgi:hypothetical protein